MTWHTCIDCAYYFAGGKSIEDINRVFGAAIWFVEEGARLAA